MGSKQKARRDRLFAEHPFCDQCHCRLIHPRDCVNPLTGKCIHRDNMATLEHDHSRLNTQRWEHESGPHTRLLCHKCNCQNSVRDNLLVRDLLRPWGHLIHWLRSRAGRRVIIRLILQHQITDIEIWFWEAE